MQQIQNKYAIEYNSSYRRKHSNIMESNLKRAVLQKDSPKKDLTDMTMQMRLNLERRRCAAILAEMMTLIVLNPRKEENPKDTQETNLVEDLEKEAQTDLEVGNVKASVEAEDLLEEVHEAVDVAVESDMFPDAMIKVSISRHSHVIRKKLYKNCSIATLNTYFLTSRKNGR